MDGHRGRIPAGPANVEMRTPVGLLTFGFCSGNVGR